MKERLVRVPFNDVEEIVISLEAIGGEPHVELRAAPRGSPDHGNGPPGRRAVVLPVGVLPDLLRVMAEVHERLIQRGLISLAAWDGADPGQSSAAHRAALPNRMDARRHPRVRLNIPVECRLLDPTTFWPGKWVAGTLMNLSLGGAQVWLRERFPRFKQIEVIGTVEGRAFRERALIVGADLLTKDVKRGRYRHSLRWVGMGAHAHSLLTMLATPAGGETATE
jgi:hypothetical protein